MSDSNLHDQVSPQQAPEPETVTETEAAEKRARKTVTRRQVLAMAGCGVAGLVVGGVLATWG